jgi:hypothetical protein
MIKEYSEDIDHYIDILREFAKFVLPEKLFNMLKIDNFEHFYEEDKIRIIKAISQALKFFYLEKPELTKSAIDYDKNITNLNSCFFLLADSLKDFCNSCDETGKIMKRINSILLEKSNSHKQIKKIIH